MKPTNFDYIYSAIFFIMGLILMLSPRTFMRGAKYDEESIKTESLVKKIGIGLMIIAVILTIYIYLR